MKYKLAIFDMDGTIVDSRPFHASVFEDFLRQNWKTIDYQTCYEAVGITVKAVFESVGIPQERHPVLFDMLSEYYEKGAGEFLKKTGLAKGIVPFVKYLRQLGIRTAIVTNSLNDVVDMFMGYHKIGHLFDEVVGADPHSHSKNERCRIIAEKFGAAPGEIIYIGDSEGDMILSNEMGYDACFAKTEIAWHKDENYIANVLKPKYTVDSYEELQSLFAAMEDEE